MSKKFSFLFLLLLGTLFSLSTVQAADPKLTIKDPDKFAAKFVSQSIPDPIRLEAGTEKTVVIKFKNIGTEIWNEKGPNYLSAYTVEPKYRLSAFAGKTWLGKEQPAKIKGIVKPGGIGELSFVLTAPNKAGDYTEEFHLAAENASWVNKGYFFVKVTVLPSKTPVIKLTDSSSVPQPEKLEVKKIEAEPYDAERILQSQKDLTLEGGEQVKLIVSFKNTGTKTWKQYSLLSPELGNLAGDEKVGNFADESWQSKRVVLQKIHSVKPNEKIKETFYFRAPKAKGEYTARFLLAADGTALSDEILEVHIDVTKNAPQQYKEPKLKSDDIVPLDIYKIKEEPYLRVGVFKLEKPEKDTVKFLSDEADYQVMSADKVLFTLPQGVSAELSYKSGLYSFKSGKKTVDSSEPFRLLPVDNVHAVFSVPNLKRAIEWHKGVNFDAYRGRMEYRVTDDKKSAYVINEILLEDYMYGIAETSNGTHKEYIKALQTAARTYAYYVMSSGEKYTNGHFDLVAHTGDQLYLGYKNEALRPNVVRFTNETRGSVITYDVDKNSSTPNTVVITPYFGNSDGMTRSWSKVWGGTEKPWLVPVKAIYDKRDKKKMYGHGVGMSQRDAMIKADEEHLDYKQLLKYYYTDVEIEKLYP